MKITCVGFTILCLDYKLNNHIISIQEVGSIPNIMYDTVKSKKLDLQKQIKAERKNDPI